MVSNFLLVIDIYLFPRFRNQFIQTVSIVKHSQSLIYWENIVNFCSVSQGHSFDKLFIDSIRLPFFSFFNEMFMVLIDRFVWCNQNQTTVGGYGSNKRSSLPTRFNQKPGMRALIDQMERETPRPKSPHMNNEEPIELAHFPNANRWNLFIHLYKLFPKTKYQMIDRDLAILRVSSAMISQRRLIHTPIPNVDVAGQNLRNGFHNQNPMLKTTRTTSPLTPPMLKTLLRPTIPKWK